MNDSYYEQIVNGKPTMKMCAIGVGLTILAIAGMFFSLMISYAFIVAIIAIAVLIMYVFPRVQVEYEYIMVNSEMEISAIYKKQNRKKLAAIDFKTVEGVRPYNANSGNKYSKTLNFCDKTGNYKVYEIIYGTGQQRINMLISPDDNMVKHIKSWCGVNFQA
ncbi:MAG: DUF6106 family protein [Suipraeoptans sp.]